jgi:hypothetical protein
MSEDMVVLPVLFGSLCWISWIVLNSTVRLLTSRRQAALQARLLDTLVTRPDVVDYLNSDAGRLFVQSLGATTDAPHARIINALHAGLVLAFVGASLLLARLFVSGDTAPLLVVGVGLVGAGIGFAAAAMAAYFVSKRFGLVPSRDTRR